MREVLSRHFEDLVFRRIKSMKGLSHTAASGLVGGFARALMGATAFLAVNVLLPSTVEANPLGPGYYQRTNPLGPGYVQDSNPLGPGYIQRSNPLGDGYVQDSNPLSDGYVQDSNPLGPGYVQDKGVFGFD